ncbi:MAG: hypothetical protein ACYC0F_06195 [Rhodanobacter sp.]
MSRHRNIRRAAARPARQRGGALIEYTIVVLLLVMVLLANPNVIRQLADALREAYTSFVYALSISWI